MNDLISKEEIIEKISKLEEHFFSEDIHATVWLKKEDVMNIFLRKEKE